MCKGPVATREMQQHSLLAPDLASALDEGEDEMKVTMAHGFLRLSRQKGKSTSQTHAQKPFLGSLEAVWRCRMRRTWKKHQKKPFNRKTGEACDPVCRWGVNHSPEATVTRESAASALEDSVAA